MSDPMTNSEVEDVLSSIRRLVSDEKRAEAAAPEPAKPMSDRLVLTPSLRVMENDPPQKAPEAPQDGTAAPDLVSDAQASDMQADDARDHDKDVDDPHANEQCTDDTYTDHRFETGALHADRPDPAAAGTAASETRGGEATADAMASAQPSPAKKRPFLLMDHLDVADLKRPKHAPTSRLTLSDDTDAVAPDPSATQPPEQGTGQEKTLGAKIAELETLIAGRLDQWEPDQAGTDAYAGTEPPAMAWDETDCSAAEPVNSTACPQLAEDAAHGADGSDDTEATAKAAYDANDERAQDTDASDVAHAALKKEAGAGPLHLDQLSEEALHKLVSEIVREELQGALGARITRNVRKLVRRELHRALIEQDLG